ncbi:TRAP transporter 4TM/12TM fusion protein [Bradyrhizobium sp. LM3.2]
MAPPATCRKRRSRAFARSAAPGAGRWWAATAATILLCINQQFSLRFFVGYTQLNTEYFYLLIALMLPFTFLIFPGTERAPLDRIPWYDLLCFVVTFAAALLLMSNVRKAAEAGWEFGGAPNSVIAAGLVMWVMLMEALRRTGGWSLLLSVLPFTVYPLFAESGWLGPFRGTQSTLEQATAYHVLSGESLLGIPIQAFADTVIGFLVFGTALMMTGAGKFFINLAFALCGTFRGGAAKVCIFASGLLGMMSGSIISNVLTAGTMTIPVMKKSGFRASYAGAIEACASTGAVLAPPVMGATAFVIAQFLNVGYADVAIAAIIPAVLYYVGLFMQVDSYAARHGLKGIPRAELPRIMDTIRDGWYYVFVIALLIVMLLYFKRESHAPFYATALLLVLNQLFSKDTRWTVATIGKFLEVNGRTFVELVGILAGCGLLIGAFSMTGVVSSLANDLLRIAGDNPFLLLGMCALTSLILGLGLTTTACYIFLAILVAPALEKLGLNKMAVHMFIFYWGMLSSITPPVAIASFAAARHCRLACDEDGLGIDVGREHHLFHSVFLRAQSGAGAAGGKPLSRRPRPDGACGLRHAVHLRRHPGLPALRRRSPRRRCAGMADPRAAGDRRVRGGHPRRRHHAAVADAGDAARPRHPRAHGFARPCSGPAPDHGAGRVARALIALHKERR